MLSVGKSLAWIILSGKAQAMNPATRTSNTAFISLLLYTKSAQHECIHVIQMRYMYTCLVNEQSNKTKFYTLNSTNITSYITTQNCMME